MVLTPRLRSHIADPSAVETDMSSEPNVSYSSRKRHRSVTYDGFPELPTLPKLSGMLVLEVFTHRSLRLACHASYGDNERLTVLGQHVLEMIITQLLFTRKPKLKRENIEVLRRALLSDEIIDVWSRLYRLRDELRYDSSFQSSVDEPEQGRSLFLAYLGATFEEHGLVEVEKWIRLLFQLTAAVMDEFPTIDFGDDGSEEQAGKRLKVEEASQGPSGFSLNFVPLGKSSVDVPVKHYNPYSSQPTPPLSAPPPIPPPPPPPMRSFSPNPLAPAQPNLAFLPLFNQTAAQRGMSVEYPATFTGPPHAGRWHVICKVNGIEKGRELGLASSSRKSKLPGWRTLPWAGRPEVDGEDEPMRESFRCQETPILVLSEYVAASFSRPRQRECDCGILEQHQCV
ncbi:hypothetical protein EDD17DRAFT_588273 [Pisolithus thermaeus]|nr:hypothetical protein EDD17DRAFT_588273 [Pisolithus thermaeus]